MAGIRPYMDVLLGNKEDASDVLNIKAASSDVRAGEMDVGGYPEVAAKIVERIPNLPIVATTLRESLSPTRNNRGVMLVVTPATPLRTVSSTHSGTQCSRNPQPLYGSPRPLPGWPTRWRGTSTTPAAARWKH